MGSKRSSRRLALEPLEPRLLLAGAVTAVVSGGNLVITGDNVGNEITVTQAAPSDYTITGGGGTTVNGNPSDSVSGVTKNVIIDIGGGDDTITLNSTALPRNLTVKGGTGNNDLTLYNTNILGGLKILGEDGDDVVRLEDVNVGRNTLINLKDGVNGIQTSAGAGKTNTIGGNLSILMRDGTPTVTLSAVAVAGKTTIKARNGNSDFDLLSFTSGGSVKIMTGNGLAETRFHNFRTGGSASVLQGSGDNTFEMTASATGLNEISGDLLYRGADQMDQVSIEGTRVGGSVKHILKNGINGCAWDGVSAGKAGIVRGGSDADNAHLAEFRTGGNLTVALGEGVNDTALDAVSTNGSFIGRDLILTGGDGNDKLKAVNVTVGRNVRLGFGDGIGDATIGESTIHGKVLYTGGSGVDEFGTNDTSIGRGVTALTGGGNDSFGFNDTRIIGAVKGNLAEGKDTFVCQSSILSGPVRLLGGADDDTITVHDGTTCHNLLDIRMGDGEDDLVVDHVFLGGPLFVDAGNDDDTVEIARATDNLVDVRGVATVRLGGGDDYIGLGAFIPGGWARFRGPVLFDGGADVDTIARLGSPNQFALGFTEINIENVV